MQDRVLQMLQLIQFYTTVKFSIEITNSFIGDDIQLDKLSIIGYKSMGFDTSKISQEDNQFSIKVERPIPMGISDNLFTWAKYGKIILPSFARWICEASASFHISKILS